MAKYTVEITETLQKQFEVEADSENEAINFVEEKYKGGKDDDYILDSSNFMDVDIKIIK